MQKLRLKELGYLSVILVSVIFVTPGCDIFHKSMGWDRSRGFQYPPDTKDQVTIHQGVWGNVWFWEGDFMPSDRPPRGTITPVVREVYVYKATPLDSVIGPPYSPFYSKILTPLVATTTSNSTGFFQVELQPGKYSFFVKEDSLFYANLFDDYHIQPATVVKDSVIKRQIDITYKASW